jgi:hypothetical protein
MSHTRFCHEGAGNEQRYHIYIARVLKISASNSSAAVLPEALFRRIESDLFFSLSSPASLSLRPLYTKTHNQ